MRSRVRPTWETFLIPRRRAHYNPMRSRVARNRLGHAAMRWLVVRHGGAGVGGGWRRTVRGGVPKVTKSCKKRKRIWLPKRLPKVIPTIGTRTRTLVHCYLKTNYAREGYQNMTPKWESFLVPKTGNRTRTLVHCYLKANYAREGYQNMYPKWEPFLVPKTGTRTRTLVHCYLKTKYAREGYQNMSPKWEPFLVPKTGTHYNPMRSRVRPKLEPFLVPRRRIHYSHMHSRVRRKRPKHTFQIL